MLLFSHTGHVTHLEHLRGQKGQKGVMVYLKDSKLLIMAKSREGGKGRKKERKGGGKEGRVGSGPQVTNYQEVQLLFYISLNQNHFLIC